MNHDVCINWVLLYKIGIGDNVYKYYMRWILDKFGNDYIYIYIVVTIKVVHYVKYDWIDSKVCSIVWKE